MSTFHDDAVLYLGVGSDVAVVADDGGASYGSAAVDGGAPTYGDVILLCLSSP